MKGEELPELAIRLHKHPEYFFKDVPYSHLPRVPLRGLILGKSSAGKGVWLCDVIVRLYAGCFERVYVWSPSVDLDHQWDPVKRYSERVLKVDPSKEKCFFSTWNEAEVRRVIDSHTKVTSLAKEMGQKTLHSVLIVVDDFADQRGVCHSMNSPLVQLFVRGRHAGISTLVSSQYYHCIDPIIRTNATFLIAFKITNGKELGCVLESLSALYPLPELKAIYEEAVDEPFSYLYVNLKAHRKEDMFFKRFDGGRILPDL